MRNQKPAKLDYEKLSESVVKVECYDEDGNEYATGSGVVVLYNNVVVTNYHVVSEDAYSFVVIADDGQSREVTSVIAYDENKDIAILQLGEATNITPLPIGDSTILKRGDKVFAIGSPLGLLNTVTEGIVSGFVKDGDITAIQTSAPISQGSSGGALLNDRGELIGITYAGIDEGQNLNFAIPSYEISYVWDNGKVDLNVEDFYNLREHVKTYSVKELIANWSTVNGEKVQVYGYLSYYLENSFLLVPSSAAVYEDPHSLYPNGGSELGALLLQYYNTRDKSLPEVRPEDSNDMSRFHPGDYVLVTGICNVWTVEGVIDRLSVHSATIELIE